MNAANSSLPNTLKHARHARRLSQLELSLRVGVSQRHLSFVESGRANPSRALLMAWLQELDAPLALRNAALLQAGYAPVYGAAPLSDPTMARADQAIGALLKSHDPLPAFVIDSHWNLLRMNQGGRWLAATLMPWISSVRANTPEGTPLNMLDLLVHRQGFASCMLNLSEVGPELLSHLRDEASLLPSLSPQVDAFAAFLTKVRVPADRAAHVGDDLPDLSLFSECAFGISVPNGHPAVRAGAAFITATRGGDGVARELCELILRAKGLWHYS